jgi:hypothetical protein
MMLPAHCCLQLHQLTATGRSFTILARKASHAELCLGFVAGLQIGWSWLVLFASHSGLLDVRSAWLAVDGCGCHRHLVC